MRDAQLECWKIKLAYILKKGKLSPLLREALIETIKALRKKDYKLACQLTACKSFITGKIDPKDKKNAFQEHHKYNERLFKASVYSILDTCHHHLAYHTGEVPSGMVIIGVYRSGKTCVKEFKSKGVHPLVQRQRYEHMICVKDARKFHQSIGL
jgi:hypothetical protein